MRSAAVLLLLAATATSQERRVFGRIRTRLPDTVELRLLLDEQVVATREVLRDGRFDISGLRPGLYRLQAFTKRHEWFDEEINLYAPGREITARLEPARTLRGCVVLRGVPEGKTTVELVPVGRRRPFSHDPRQPPRKTTCASDGTFRFDNCGGAKRWVVVHHNYGMVGEDETDVYRSAVVDLAGTQAQTTIVVEPDEDVRLAVRLPEGVDEVEGRLGVAGLSAHGVPRFLFHVHRGERGESRIFRGNRGGFYDFSKKRKAASVRVPGFWKGEFRMALMTRGCKEIERKLRIDGPTLLDFELEGVRGQTVTLTKAPDGEFEIAGTGITQDTPFGFLPEGRTWAVFRSDRYSEQRKPIEVTHGPEPLVLSFDFEPAPTVTGKLANAEGAPISVQPPNLVMISVHPKWRIRQAVVDGGRFEVAALPPGRYEVRIRDLVLTTFEMGTDSITLDLKLPE